MEQNKYTAELMKIEKLERKVAIKEANGMDTSADEFEKEIAMLELVEKVATLEKRKTISQAEFEAKLIAAGVSKGNNSKEYCVNVLDAFEKQLQKCDDSMQNKDYKTLKHNMNVTQHLGKAIYHILISYCSENNVDESAEYENINGQYPEIKYNKDMNYNDILSNIKQVIILFHDLIIDFKNCIDSNNLECLLTLTALLFRYSTTIIRFKNHL